MPEDVFEWLGVHPQRELRLQRSEASGWFATCVDRREGLDIYVGYGDTWDAAALEAIELFAYHRCGAI